MTVVEARGRGGQLLERFRSQKTTLTIGRAFDNDIILEDEYVSAHHLRLFKLEHGWQFEDIDTLNGSRRRSRHSSNGVLHSGDEIRVGHTVLHIYDDQHPVEPALQLDGAEARLSSLASHGTWLTLFALSVAVSVISAYWASYEEFKPLTLLEPVISGALGMFLVAAFWAFVGRLLRHKAYFFSHLSLWLIFSLVGVLAALIAQWVAYNAQSQLLETILHQGMSFCTLTIAVWSSFTLATNLRGKGRIYAALGVASVFLAIGLASQFRFQREFSARPDYYARLKPPAFLLAKPLAEAQLIDELPALFDRADTEIEDDELADIAETAETEAFDDL